MTEETTRLIIEWGGNYVTWATCERCGQSVQYPTEKPYNACPYCFARVIYEQKEEKHG